ncbi:MULTISPECIES: integrase core domain-containing protein [Clostridia]|uniref:integrase core domain-containing protein n=1 Tax=Clostridia TaxID=186801 RepID=UPI0017863E2A|nr:integrase core domain-containing protein [Thermoanaerobacterium thermosaccharolyticum]MBE0068267.1 transposase family protein [Thermoanaerobacterium thermosaccharolyticum]MBE0228162.1 transposase family protein [Thermoanaerobacterium thermosaccharolyticum]
MSLTEIPVEFTSDEKGYYDRQCPNEKCEYVFKIYMEDWKEKVSDEQVFCPMSHKKVYRLCKELKILKDQRVIKPAVKSKISVNRIVKKSNALWEADIKYGYITGEDKFFFVLSVIDVLDRSIIDYYMGYSCTGSDAASLIKRCLLKRNLFNSKDKPVIRTDNGPQFISHIFEDSCVEVGVYHERIPSRTPNKNAHIESFHRILQDECIGVYEFQSYKDAYIEISRFMKRYNNNRIHSSLKYKTPNDFYIQNFGKEIESMAIHL